MNVQYNIQIQPPNRAIPYHVLSDYDANLQSEMLQVAFQSSTELYHLPKSINLY